MRNVQQRQAGKMLVPLLGVLAVLAMGVAAFAIVLQMQERDKRQATERQLHLAVAENDDLKGRLDELQQDKARIEEELGHVRKDLTQSKEDLIKAVEAQETLTRSVEDREREISRLAKDLDQTRNESKQISAQLSELQTERESLKQQLADLEHAKGELESKVMELSERPTVELEKVMVTNDASASQPSAAAAASAGVAMPVSGTTRSVGRVMVINRDYDFIVMSLGKNQGVSVGQEFQVVRGNDILGKVKVEKVYDELSAATILPGSQKDAIRAGEADGDVVRAL